MSGVRVRFAPSPTGSLHLGNARTALFNWLFARRELGVFVLRVEDTDIEREVAGAEPALREDLRWLGIAWDEGPDTGGPHGPYRQSERSGVYRTAAERLRTGKHAYPCFCTTEQLEADRAAQQARGETPRYPGRCAGLSRAEGDRRLAAGEAAALRLRITGWPAFTDLVRGRLEFGARTLSDPVLVRRDGRPTYNFAVVVDDLAMKITHVLRGDDHISNTPVQVAILEALGESPPQYAHLPTVLGPDGTPLSKRHGAVSLAEMRRRGYPPEAVAAALWRLGWTPPEDLPPDLAAAAAVFDLAHVSPSPAAFDAQRLDHLGEVVLAGLPPLQRAVRALPFLGPLLGEAAAAAWAPAALDWLGRLLDLWSRQARTFTDYADLARWVFRFDESLESATPAVRDELSGADALRVNRAAAAAAAERGPVRSIEDWKSLCTAVGGAAGVKGRALFHPLRLALTAAENGPELQRLAPLLDEGAGFREPAAIRGVRERLELASRAAPGAATP